MDLAGVVFQAALGGRFGRGVGCGSVELDVALGDAAGGGLDDGFQRVGGVAAPIAVKFLRNAGYDAAAH